MASYPTTFSVSALRDCQRLSLTAAKLRGYLLENGLAETQKADDAELVLLFLCDASEEGKIRSRRTISRALRSKRRGAHLVVTGCLDNLQLEESFSSGFSVIPVEELSCLDDLLRATIKLEEIPITSCSASISDLEDIPGRGFFSKHQLRVTPLCDESLLEEPYCSIASRLEIENEPHKPSSQFQEGAHSPPSDSKQRSKTQ